MYIFFCIAMLIMISKLYTNIESVESQYKCFCFEFSSQFDKQSLYIYVYVVCAYLDDSRLIENRVPCRLIAFHIPQDTTYTDIVRVDQTKGSDIDKIVLEVLEVEGFDILWKSERIESQDQVGFRISISPGYLQKS